MRQIKSILKSLKESHPRLHYLLCSAWYRRHFRTNTKKISGKHNKVSRRDAILNGVKFDIRGDGNIITIDSLAVLEGVIFHIRGNGNRILIGADCTIAGSTIWVEDNRCEVRIGRQTTVGGMHLAATEDHSRVVIGDDCMLAYGIDIRTGDSHAIYAQTGNRVNGAQDVVIGNHVWIAAHTIILKGAMIGSGSVVAAGAVVPKGDYQENCILAGNPAKAVKHGIYWTRSRKVQVKDC